MDRQIYLDITRIDEDQRIVEAYGTRGDIKDSFGTFIDLDSAVRCMDAYMEYPALREMHQPVAAGSTLSYEADDKGVMIRAKVVDDDAWKKVKEKVYRGFSVGGNQDFTMRDGINVGRVSPSDWQDNDIIHLKSITEFSLVDSPANKGCGDLVYRISSMEENMDTEEKKAQESDAAATQAVKEQSDAERVAKRDDADPKEGKKKYGNVDFADEKNKKYPIDTAAHIKAAWNYINKPKNAGKYSAEDLKSIKGKIVAAWKKVIDKAGPPSADDTKKADQGDVERGIWDADLCKYITDETDDCLTALYALQSIINLRTSEAAEGEADPEGQKQIDSLTAAISALKDFIESEIQENDEAAGVQKAAEPDSPQVETDTERKGAVLSKSNKNHAQSIHDHAVQMGASCDTARSAAPDIARIAGALEVEADTEEDLIRVLADQRKADMAEIERLKEIPAAPGGDQVTRTISKEEDAGQPKKIKRLEDMEEFKALSADQQAFILTRAAMGAPMRIGGSHAEPSTTGKGEKQ